MKELLKVEHLCVGYASKEIVHDVSFSLQSGKFYALLGENGCGKTTLLKGIQGILKSKGNLVCNQQSLLHMKPKERSKKISYISVTNEITYPISVREVLELGLNPYLRMFENPNKEMLQGIEEIASTLHLETFMDQNFLTLSEGQKQLVIFGRCMVQDSCVLLLDEPDSAMDLMKRNEMFTTIKSYLQVHEKSALMSIHNPNYAMRYCDEILLMKDGVLLEQIHMKEESIVEVERKMRLIYQDVEIIQHKENPYMVYL